MDDEKFKGILKTTIKNLEEGDKKSSCILYNLEKDEASIMMYNKEKDKVVINPEIEVILLELDYQEGKKYTENNLDWIESDMFERYASFRRLNRYRHQLEEYCPICIKKYDKDEKPFCQVILDINIASVVMHLGEDAYERRGNAIVLFQVDENTKKDFEWLDVLRYNNLLNDCNIVKE